jgi:hypothetical protein
MSYRPFEVFVHERAFREYTGEQEREEYGDPDGNRTAPPSDYRE